MITAELMKKLDKIKDPHLKDILLYILERTEKSGDEANRKEFHDFVRTTNENFAKIWKAIGELTEAQKRTEKQINQLVEAQKKTEERLHELAEAQKKTEERLNELTEAQKRTEERLNQLTERVDKIEERLDRIAKNQKEIRKELGGLAHSFGYFLEDRAYKGFPSILKERFGIEITQPLRRIYVKVSGNRYAEINIFGIGKRKGKEVYIIGECKVRLSRRDVDSFLKTLEKASDKWKGEKVMFLVAYQVPPSVVEYAERKGINLIYSYELPL